MTSANGDIEDIIRAARAGAVEPQALFTALAEAPLLLAGAPAEDDMFLPFVINRDGADFAAVFTSSELTRTLPDAPGFAQLAGRDIGANWPDGLGAIVNIDSPDVSLVFDTGAVRMLANPEEAGELSRGGGVAATAAGPTDISVAPSRPLLPAGEAIMIGAPANPPAPEFVDALRTAVSKAADVEVAYIFQMVDGTQTSRLMVGTVLREGADQHTAMTDLVDAVAAAHAPAADVDFMVLSDDLRGTVSKYVDALR